MFSGRNGNKRGFGQRDGLRLLHEYSETGAFDISLRPTVQFQFGHIAAPDFAVERAFDEQIPVAIGRIACDFVPGDAAYHNRLAQRHAGSHDFVRIGRIAVRTVKDESGYSVREVRARIYSKAAHMHFAAAAEIDANEAALKEISAKLIAVAEAYPDLKANQNYQQTMASIEKYEENVRLSRMTYNDTVTRLNTQVRSFPTSLIAGVLGFSKRDYLADDVTKKDYPVI